MPTATKFNALGAGNGFPRWGSFDHSKNPPEWVDGTGCLSKIDVSTCDLVAPMTLAQASKMFWTAHKVAGSASYIQNEGDPGEEVISVNMDSCLGMTPWGSIDPDFYLLDGAPATEPKDRDCNRLTPTEPLNYDPDPTSVSHYTAAVPPYSPDLNNPGVEFRLARPFRYYDGDVTDEANFIGYGFGGGSGFVRAEASIGNSHALAGYASAIDTAIIPIGTWAETTVSGIPVLKFTQTGGAYSSTATLGEFEFYTY